MHDELHDDWKQVHWIQANNTSAFEVPSFGLMEVINTTHPGRLILETRRPTADHVFSAINSWKPIQPGGYGWATLTGPAILTNSYAGTTVIGDSFGAAADTFIAEKDHFGYTSLDIDSHGIYVMQSVHARFYKPLIEFQLTEAMNTADRTATATIVLQHGHGFANPNTGVSGVTVYNPISSVYTFDADSGDRGLADWMDDPYDKNAYMITAMKEPQ